MGKGNSNQCRLSYNLLEMNILCEVPGWRGPWGFWISSPQFQNSPSTFSSYFNDTTATTTTIARRQNLTPSSSTHQGNRPGEEARSLLGFCTFVIITTRRRNDAV
ncbi:hypothetical protein PIB30_045060 [Stylosanthes scabra]|uniref:Uncharacterized protein n=1 Tax=Stylosanthes scabra TaxID=79078 RepID=A0ABU6UFB3_9FABA|nr:hypothetical protein [Stylosanthes scabra]